ncbi:hypothetical protein A9Z42_0013580 [Trichoderma parareesei]|uniref:Uncharacterized protein n=1 Tax=Trichoderma parareesei TaxID=858221 RepID=A0A2H2ZLV9_TRIPA|nr:hypothetical protein A9Z42_0013580 [Trichoderma parareesei]
MSNIVSSAPAYAYLAGFFLSLSLASGRIPLGARSPTRSPSRTFISPCTPIKALCAAVGGLDTLLSSNVSLCRRKRPSPLKPSRLRNLLGMTSELFLLAGRIPSSSFSPRLKDRSKVRYTSSGESSLAALWRSTRMLTTV